MHKSGYAGKIEGKKRDRERKAKLWSFYNWEAFRKYYTELALHYNSISYEELAQDYVEDVGEYWKDDWEVSRRRKVAKWLTHKTARQADNEYFETAARGAERKLVGYWNIIF